MENFPKLKFKSFEKKGCELADLTVLMDAYRKWGQECYPYGLHFDDFVKRLESKLAKKEKHTQLDQEDSVPEEHLLKLRFLHKMGIKVEEAAKKSEAASTLSPEEKKRRIEENRKKALERKRLRQEADAKAKQETQAPPTSQEHNIANGTEKRDEAKAEEETSQDVAGTVKAEKPAEVPTPAACLSPEEKRRRIEENRQKALERKRQRGLEDL